MQKEYKTMNNFMKWAFFILLFLVSLNGIGWYLLQGKEQKDSHHTQEEIVEVDEVTISIVNNGNYDDVLLQDIKNNIEKSTHSIFSITNGILTPKKEVSIVLQPYSEDKHYFPPYLSSIVYDPNNLWMETWNIEEHLLYSLFPKKAKTSPFTTIGLGYHLYQSASPKEIMDAHDYWLIHEQHHSDVDVKALLVNHNFTEDVLYLEYGPVPEARYYGIASFSKYLIDTYGIQHYVSLYDSPNVENDINPIYGKSIEDLLQEWNSYIEKKRSFLSPYQLDSYQYEYQNLYP
jgi:hypothetical protein